MYIYVSQMLYWGCEFHLNITTSVLSNRICRNGIFNSNDLKKKKKRKKVYLAYTKWFKQVNWRDISVETQTIRMVRLNSWAQESWESLSCRQGFPLVYWPLMHSEQKAQVSQPLMLAEVRRVGCPLVYQCIPRTPPPPPCSVQWSVWALGLIRLEYICEHTH